jgi:8-oxo-dGTP pyrophosphatase MutT (NUDIX family)
MTDQLPIAAPAATIILVRPAGVEFEVYLLKRSTKSKFMAGNYVFPGGMVDDVDRDAEKWLVHVDMDLAGIEKRLGGGLDAKEALAYGVAAIRETFEEAGVLLARQKGPVGNALAKASRQREADDHKPGWFLDLVAEHNWCLEFTRLFRWAHWVTPKAMKRHFDTRFYVATMPLDQTCLPDARETTEGVWMRPLEGLEANTAGGIGLSPPTLVTLHALLKFNSFDALQEDIANRPWGAPINPWMIPLAKGPVIIEPWDPDYGQERIDINPDKLIDKMLPVGVDFSRLWLNDGLWCPVAI